MLKTKPYHYPKGNESKNLTGKNKGQASKTKTYVGKKTLTKTQGLYLKTETTFKGRYSDLEVYIFDLGPRAS